MVYILIGLGSGLGGIARYWCSNLLTKHMEINFPIETLIVNVLGSLLIGSLMSLNETLFSTCPMEYRQFATIGFCGGYTTFSAFSLQTFHLIQNGNLIQASTNIFFSIIACLLAVWMGSIIPHLWLK